jgi:hypothetical protein
MKHLATIQSEFLKQARKWNDLSLEDQKAYLKRHPKTKRRLTARPKSAPKSGVYDSETQTDEIDKFIQKFSDKYDSAIEIWMSDENKQKLYKMYKSGKYNFKSVIQDTDDFITWVDNSSNIDQFIKNKKDKGWQLFDSENNMDQHEFIFYKTKSKIEDPHTVTLDTVFSSQKDEQRMKSQAEKNGVSVKMTNDRATLKGPKDKLIKIINKFYDDGSGDLSHLHNLIKPLKKNK